MLSLGCHFTTGLPSNGDHYCMHHDMTIRTSATDNINGGWWELPDAATYTTIASAEDCWGSHCLNILLNNKTEHREQRIYQL